MPPTQRLGDIKHHIGMDAFLTLKNGLKVRVRITNVRVPYGHIRYTVTPVAGEGETTVNSENITIITDESSRYHEPSNY